MADRTKIRVKLKVENALRKFKIQRAKVLVGDVTLPNTFLIF